MVALDYQPVVIRTTAETIHINIGGEVRGLSDSTSGNWDLTRTAPSALGEHLNGFPEAGRTQGSLTREAGAHPQPKPGRPDFLHSVLFGNETATGAYPYRRIS